MFGNVFKRIFGLLVAAAFLLGAGLGAYIGFGRVDAPQSVHRPTETPAAETPAPAVTGDAAVSPSASVPPETPAASPAAQTNAPADLSAQLSAYINGMTTEQKIGQLLLFGFAGTSNPSDEFQEIIQTYHVGNFMLYGANIESNNFDGGFGQARDLTDALKAEIADDGIAPLIAIDVEGGTVVRFHWSTWPYSARTLGQRDDPDLAAAQFASIGEQLIDSGINLNLAPVLDVAADPQRTFLKTRIISSDADVTARIGAGIIDGLHAVNCLSAAKHFPGHGGTTLDSHDALPVIDKTAEELAAYDLVPFEAAIAHNVDAMLIAHIRYPAFDDADIASVSPAIINGLLRTQMGFQGLVVSDDFRMGSVADHYDMGDAAVRFILAGGDMVMCGAQHDKQRKIADGLLAAVSDGTLSESRLDESVLRILAAKCGAGVWQIP